MHSRPILVVDDDDDVRNMLCAVLAAEGYPVVGAADVADPDADGDDRDTPSSVQIESAVATYRSPSRPSSTSLTPAGNDATSIASPRA